MTSETVPVVVGVLGLIRERMDQNLGKIRGVSDIDELQKITLPVHTNGAHTEKVSVHRIKNSRGTSSGPRIGPRSRRV